MYQILRDSTKPWTLIIVGLVVPVDDSGSNRVEWAGFSAGCLLWTPLDSAGDCRFRCARVLGAVLHHGLDHATTTFRRDNPRSDSRNCCDVRLVRERAVPTVLGKFPHSVRWPLHIHHGCPTRTQCCSNVDGTYDASATSHTHTASRRHLPSYAVSITANRQVVRLYWVILIWVCELFYNTLDSDYS